MDIQFYIRGEDERECWVDVDEMRELLGLPEAQPPQHFPQALPVHRTECNLPPDHFAFCGRAHTCPVCNGQRSVPAGFYSLGRSQTINFTETCRTCAGTGVLWGKGLEGAKPRE